MRRLVAAAAVIAFAGAGHADVPRTVDKSAKIDFNGTWVDADGRSWEISQDGQVITLKAPSGATFDGQVSGREFDAFHELTFGETRKDLPPPVRQMIAGERVIIEGTLSADGESIDATYVDKDPSWEKDVQSGAYRITGMNEGRRGMRFERPADIHVGRIRVSYEPADKRLRELRTRITELESSIASIDPLVKEAEARYAAAMIPYQRAKAKEEEIRAKVRGAKPHEGVQLQIDYLEALIFTQRLKDAGADGGNPAFVKALDERNALRKQLVAKGIQAPLPDQKTVAQLQQLLDALTKQQGGAKLDLAALEDVALVAHGDFEKAESEWDIAIGVLGSLSARRRPLVEEKARLEAQLPDRRWQGGPQLTQVDVTGPAGKVYSATWWDPADALAAADAAIAQVDPAIEGASASVDRLRIAYDEAKQEEARLGATVVSGIWKSAGAQYGLEALDFLGDVLKNSKEEGLVVGGLHAVFKKIFDMGKDVVWSQGDFSKIGDYEFLDESQIREEMLQGASRDEGPSLATELSDASWGSMKELINTHVTKSVIQWVPKVKLVMDYCIGRAKGAEAIASIGAKRAIAGGLGGMFTEVGLPRTAGDMALDAFKDYAKGKLKAGARETFEGTAWREYFNAELYRIALHHQWGGATVRLRTLVKLRAGLKAKRDEIMRDYEQNDLNHYQGAEAAPLKQKKDYTAHLTWKGPAPSKIELHFNVPARGSVTDQTFNTGTMKGTYDVDVTVVEY